LITAVLLTLLAARALLRLRPKAGETPSF
jgi:hypothetical protein